MISPDVFSTEYLGQTKVVNTINPVVSVCVLAYNHAAYIAECLDGILMQQTDFPFEIIIGEDNSTDGTREICKKYAAQHPDKIRLFLRRPDQKIDVNGKKSFHFNLIETLKSARGEYVATCDGDDYWTNPDKLQKQADFLNDHPEVSLCVHSYQNGEENRVHLSGEIKIETLAYSMPFQTSTVMCRTKYLDRYTTDKRFFEIGFADFPIGLILAKNGKVVALPEVMSYYRVHAKGIWTSLDFKTAQMLKLKGHAACFDILGLNKQSYAGNAVVKTLYKLTRLDQNILTRTAGLFRLRKYLKYTFRADSKHTMKLFKALIFSK